MKDPVETLSEDSLNNTIEDNIVENTKKIGFQNHITKSNVITHKADGRLVQKSFQ